MSEIVVGSAELEQTHSRLTEVAEALSSLPRGGTALSGGGMGPLAAPLAAAADQLGVRVEAAIASLGRLVTTIADGVEAMQRSFEDYEEQATAGLRTLGEDLP